MTTLLTRYRSYLRAKMADTLERSSGINGPNLRWAFDQPLSISLALRLTTRQQCFHVDWFLAANSTAPRGGPSDLADYQGCPCSDLDDRPPHRNPARPQHHASFGDVADGHVRPPGVVAHANAKNRLSAVWSLFPPCHPAGLKEKRLISVRTSVSGAVKAV
jgi:hypothetical protein